ncbi:hypothetical protein Vadar_022486 [Vaccinium darrowii]|uniref:Uncharacterized protein n=1 Tax=Vaccinium darrowii TaxID=229202 RepID=A0ACB7XBS2_9ERIC|nr:hypothetical protein Vadar_022486 [Vaccinium darrowii]
MQLISHQINSEGGHDELDFEFLDTNGTLQTNVFANDKGHREELVDLGFDPSIDFHTYLILWTSQKVEFFVDGLSVRVFPNDGRKDFFKKPMHVEASIWNGTWAGEVDWTKAPFIGLYQNFTVDGLKTNNTLQCDPLPEHSYLNMKH